MKQTELFDIKGHVAFVTGAASGLGRAYAEVMAENGAKTVLTDIDAAGLEKVGAALKAAGCDVEQAVLDIGDTDALRAAIDATAARHGRLDIMFANAGGSAGPGFELVPTGVEMPRPTPNCTLPTSIQPFEPSCPFALDSPVGIAAYFR